MFKLINGACQFQWHWFSQGFPVTRVLCLVQVEVGTIAFSQVVLIQQYSRLNAADREKNWRR